MRCEPAGKTRDTGGIQIREAEVGEQLREESKSRETDPGTLLFQNVALTTGI